MIEISILKFILIIFISNVIVCYLIKIFFPSSLKLNFTDEEYYNILLKAKEENMNVDDYINEEIAKGIANIIDELKK